MKFSLSWLRQYLETDKSVDELATSMTAIGLEVESIEDPAVKLAPFHIAHVIEAKQHPNADKLRLCVVDTGDGHVQVVCGAPNARTGMKGVFAPSGSTVPGTGLKLKPSKIRGVESNGMLCSEREMGLSDEHEGIIDLPEDAPIGQPFAAYMGLDDPLFDIAITPNRADCLGVSGIARDLAAAGMGRFIEPDVTPIVGSFKSPLGVRFEFSDGMEDACPLFVGRYIKGVKNGASPKWMQDRLLSVGLRPISALVDMTNYLTIDLNRPVHVFDADKVAGDHLWLRTGCDGAKFDALNGKEYTLDGEMTAIGDGNGVLSLAGVMGGESSGCTEETTNVFIEIALFDPVRTAATGRKLNLESDARYRFERGVDPEFAVPGMEAATRLVQEMCGGEASELVVTGAVPEWRREVAFRPSRVHSLGGVELDALACDSILQKLGFGTQELGSDHIAAEPPAWRGDIVGEADLVEEVLRIHGFDNIPAVSLPRLQRRAGSGIALAPRRLGWARRALAARGMSEAVTWSFMPEAQAKLFGGAPPELTLANPISSDLDVMRPSILPNLVMACRRNTDRGFADLALFEGGPQYAGATAEAQHRMITGVRAGQAVNRNPYTPARDVDCFDAKADALAALGAAGAPVASLQIKNEAPEWYHPGRSGTLALGPNVLGHFGELHPAILAALDVDFPLVGFELFIDTIPTPKAKAGRTRAALNISDFPAVERDFAFIVDADVPAENVLRAARGVDKKLIADVALFDIYAGEGVGEGKKSLAIAVRLEPRDRTLTDAEIEAVAKKVIDNVKKVAGGELRG
ncbi:MAG: phenylalanine--tRNA ligase subunit beta [Rhodospirillaceae bacterium]|nr:phenylalanine--tRNA ligase subunit beta [Rhodospirillaceae bacterium]MBT7294169.1 phenylalanine--tRNA ligase subunit beta [Rhodospirillaceae bacterium]